MRLAIGLLAIVMVGCSGGLSSPSRPVSEPAPPVAVRATSRPAPSIRQQPTATEEPTLTLVSFSGSQDGRWVTVVGEVRNDSERTVRFTKVVITHYDSTQAVVDTHTTYIKTQGNNLQPGQSGTFKSSVRYQDNMKTFIVEPQGR